MLSGWTGLRSLELHHLHLGVPEQDQQLNTVWSTHPHLLIVHLPILVRPNSVRLCLRRLPGSVRSLSISDPSLFAHKDFNSQLINSLRSTTAQLTHLSLIDPLTASTYPSRTPRGRFKFHRVLAHLATLERLALSVCAVADLSVALSPLTHLRELELRQYWSIPTVALGAREVGAFVRAAPALRRMTVAQGIWGQWGRAELNAVEGEAERKGVVLVLETRA